MKTPFNTKENHPNPEIECTTGNQLFGCLNGYPYNWEVSTTINNEIYNRNSNLFLNRPSTLAITRYLSMRPKVAV